MPSKWAWVVLSIFVGLAASSDTRAFLELTELSYEDACYETAEAEWSYVNSPTNRTAQETWISTYSEYAAYKKMEKEQVANVSKDSLTEPELRYKYDLIVRPGDGLLEPTDWDALVRSVVPVQQLLASATVEHLGRKLTREDVEHLLSHSGTVNDKRTVYQKWYRTFAPLVEDFAENNLLLNPKAAELNGANDVREYWEMLSGYPGGYEKMMSQWNNIMSLHKKIVDFARSHLSHKYNIEINGTIPAHTLGSLQGYDWSAMSIDMDPYTNLTYGVRKNLWKKKLLGRHLFKTASSMGSVLLNQVPQAEFWEESRFDRECPLRLINFCRDGEMRVSTCTEASITSFLSAHKTVARILINQMSAESTPILNMANRYSGLEEGVSELFGILAASPAWLHHVHLMSNTSANNDERLMVSLMITGLDVLPRLAYYLSADMWRLHVIENNITDAQNLTSAWWDFRERYEGVTTTENRTEPTYLDDVHILQNKPYLPKLLGTLLAFQLYEYIMDSTEVRYDRINEKPIDAKVIRMMQQGGADDWLGVLNKYLEIDEIYSDPLASFFSPLEDFLDEMQEEFDYKYDSVEQNSLEAVEKEIIREMNAPTTTPTTTTTTTTTARTGPSIVKPVKSGDNKTESRSSKHPKSDSSVHVQAHKSGEHETTTKRTIEVTSVPSLKPHAADATEEAGDGDAKPKMNTSKAVWAVAAVLIGMITICVIAIFGRQRCRRTPKNRRYV